MLKKFFTLAIILGVPILAWQFFSSGGTIAGQPIKVGILHSLTGTMAISEISVVDATKLAIDEINERGGLLGRKIEAIVIDGKSDWSMFAKGARKLIEEEKVSVVFGCWTSACRKTVKPVFEKLDHLLFYPVQYEGLEQSPNIVYTGAAPNQQIIPAVKWSFENLGSRFFLVASDYVFPRAANAIIKDQVTALKGKVLGEEYILLGGHEVQQAVRKIVATKPDVILNTINGDTNVSFFKELRNVGITPDKIPTVSFSIAEDELRNLDSELMVGDYGAWNYFQSVDSKENKNFVRNFKNKYGDNRVTDDPMEAGYFGVYLWAQAVEQANTDNVKVVKNTIKRQSLVAPGGIVYVDTETQHTWKTLRIGKINKESQFDIVWTSERPVRPVPFPVYRSKGEWKNFIFKLYSGWGNNWANPGNQS